MVMFHCYVSSPEGIEPESLIWCLPSWNQHALLGDKASLSCLNDFPKPPFAQGGAQYRDLNWFITISSYYIYLWFMVYGLGILFMVYIYIYLWFI